MLGTRGRAKRVAAPRWRPELAHGALPPLPLFLVLDVAGRLPVDDRMRLVFLSRAFRAMTDENSLWQDVRLGTDSGVTRASDALLLAVSAKARGTIRTLNLAGLRFSLDTITSVLRSNGESLRELDVRHTDGGDHFLSHVYAAPLLRATLSLRWMDVDMFGPCATVLRLLHNPTLRVRRLSVHAFAGAASVAALLADLEVHSPATSELRLDGRRTAIPLHGASLDSVVDFSVGRRLAALWLHSCALDDGAAPVAALTRLIAAGHVSRLELVVEDYGWALVPSQAFCTAVRCSGRLQRLRLQNVRLFDDAAAGVALLVAATGHPTLMHVDLSNNDVAPHDRPAVGAALGTLVAANGALLVLDVSSCDLADVGLRPLLDALPASTRLRELAIWSNDASQAFTALMLVAVQANASLRVLCADGWPSVPELVQLEDLVAARS